MAEQLPKQKRFEQLCETFASRLEKAGITEADLQATLPQTRRQLMERRYPKLFMTTKTGKSKTTKSKKRRRSIGQRLDALGPQYRLSKEQQRRMEELLARSAEGRLTRAERRELNALLRMSEEVMLRRAEAMERV